MRAGWGGRYGSLCPPPPIPLCPGQPQAATTFWRCQWDRCEHVPGWEHPIPARGTGTPLFDLATSPSSHGTGLPLGEIPIAVGFGSFFLWIHHCLI